MTAVAAFGCAANDDGHRFVVVIPKSAARPVTVLEDYGVQCADGRQPVVRATIERARLDLFAGEVRAEVNRRLHGLGRRTGHWSSGEVPVKRLLGKELLLRARGPRTWPGRQSPRRWRTSAASSPMSGGGSPRQPPPPRARPWHTTAWTGARPCSSR